MTQKSKSVEYVISVESENEKNCPLLFLVSQTPSWISHQLQSLNMDFWLYL